MDMPFRDENEIFPEYALYKNIFLYVCFSNISATARGVPPFLDDSHYKDTESISMTSNFDALYFIESAAASRFLAFHFLIGRATTARRSLTPYIIT